MRHRSAMLVSHRKRFIFATTVKTASTSVESYFERYCMPEGSWRFEHYRGETVSEDGIVGERKGYIGVIQSVIWWNHMPARTIRALLGEPSWSEYFKFCTIRNPFEKMVSAYRWELSLTPRPRVRSAIMRLRHPLPIGVRRLKANFEDWLRHAPMPLDRNKYVLDGKFCMDAVIRHESLSAGIREICDRLGILFEPKNLPHLKDLGALPVPLEDYYSPASIAIVQRGFDYELDRFGYSIPWR